METFISEADILIRIKKYRESLTYDEKFDFEIETSKLKMGKKGEARLKKTSASEFRKNRYGPKYEELRNKKQAA